MAFSSPKMKDDDYDAFVKELAAEVQSAIKLMSRFSDNRVIWRGVKTGDKSGLYGIVIHATNNRSAFMGKIFQGVEKIIQGLQDNGKLLGQPVFTCRAGFLASLFGTPYVFIPRGKFNALYNENIRDLAHFKGKDIDTVVDEYKVVSNAFPPEKWDDEIIFDCKDYYLVNVKKAMNELQIKVTNLEQQLPTYEEVIELLEAYSQKRLK